MKITKEQEARILALDPNFFNLELGKWYVGNYGINNVLIFFESLSDEGNIKGYGFNSDGWYDNRLTHFHYGKLSDVKHWILATPKQVEDRLEKEARNRYSTGDLVSDLSSDKTKQNLNMEIAVMQYYPSSDDMYFNALLMYNKGAWAETIKEDKYYKNSAYLFKVSQNGYYIQICDSDDCFGIQRYKTPLTTSVLVVEATEKEFNTAYKSTSERLKNLKND